MHPLQAIQIVVIVLLRPCGRTGDLIICRNGNFLLAQVPIVVGCITTGAGALQTIAVDDLPAIPGTVAAGRACQNFRELQP